MHLHKYEKIWLSFGLGSLVLFLLIIGFAAFMESNTSNEPYRNHRSSRTSRHMLFRAPKTSGLREVAEGKYTINMVASAFNYDAGKDEAVSLLKRSPLQEGSTVLFPGYY